MKRILFLVLVASALYSATYEVAPKKCKEVAIEIKDKYRAPYMAKRYRYECIKIDDNKSKEKVKK